jgi:hypothetical protein
MTRVAIQRLHYYHHYTVAALEDELVRILSSTNTVDVVEEDVDGWHNNIYIHWLYLEQAEALIYKANVYDVIPEFVIFTEHVPQELAKELKSLGKVTMNHAITNAVRRIYDSVNSEYFHTNGIYGKIKWRFAD